MFTDSQALSACRAIRFFLPKLLESALAEQVDHQISQILNQTDLEENIQVDRLLEVLDTYPETKNWLDQFLLELSSTETTKSSLPGSPGITSAIHYICPIGNDFDFYQEANEDIPLCPTHLVNLIKLT